LIDPQERFKWKIKRSSKHLMSEKQQEAIQALNIRFLSRLSQVAQSQEQQIGNHSVRAPLIRQSLPDRDCRNVPHADGEGVLQQGNRHDRRAAQLHVHTRGHAHAPANARRIDARACSFVD
jgi:hypothetical protein